MIMDEEYFIHTHTHTRIVSYTYTYTHERTHTHIYNVLCYILSYPLLELHPTFNVNI